jgi:hypothetical protein
MMSTGSNLVFRQTLITVSKQYRMQEFSGLQSYLDYNYQNGLQTVQPIRRERPFQIR